MAAERARRALMPIALLAMFVTLSVTGLGEEAPTIDEVQHLAAGYSYLRTGDFRFGREHPPLMKMLAATALLLLDLKPVESVAGWSANDRPTFDRDFLLRNTVSPWRMLFVARLPMIAIGVLMGAIVFWWARDLWGYWPGVFALFLYSLCPNLLAHSRLVTTDAGVACFTTLALFATWRFVSTDRLAWAVGGGLALGAALLTKYSAIVTAAVIAALLCLRFESPHNPTAESPVASGSLWARRGLGLAIVLVAAAVVVGIGYGSLRGWADYYRGFEEVQAMWRPEARTKWSFLWGAYSRTGFWNYYLLAQLWKTPIPVLICFLCGTVVIARDRTRWGAAAFLLLPIVAFHAAGMLSDVNIGIRHLLPVFPLMFVIAGVAWSVAHHRRRLSTALLIGLCGWYAVGTLRAAPHFISYFNELVGGPDNGIFYLDDSNIDWGQDLLRLRQYLDDYRPTRVRCAPFAPLTPREYGIEADSIGLRDLVWPQPGTTYAVSADLLQRRSLYRSNTAMRFDWLRRYRPIDKVGWSIFVYRFSTDAADADASNVVYVPRAEWYAHAIASLREILAQSPELTEARTLLSQIESERAATDDAGAPG